MATRRLEVEFIGDTKSLDRAFSKVSRNSKGLKGAFGGVAGGAKALAGGAALGAVALGAKNAADAFYDSQKVAKQTQAVLKSTGGSAKVSAKHVGDLASAISKKTGIDDEAIQSGENLLLTFKNIRNEAGKGNKIFDRSTRAITDMSAALGQDTKTSAIQLGKALNDPVKGVTALQRVGVSFTADQKKQIEQLVKHGDTLKAQKLILKELNSEFGGSAKAQATNMDRLKVTLGNLQESVGSVFVPLLEKATGGLNKFIDGMMSGSGAGGRLVGALKDAGEWLSGAFSSAVKFASGLLEQHRDDIQNVTDAIRNIGTAIKWAWENVALPVIKRVLPGIKKIVTGVFDVIGGVIKTISSLLTGRFGDAWDGVKQIFRGALEVVKGYLQAATAPVRELAAKVGGAIGGAFSDAWRAIKGAFRDLMGWLGDRLGDLKDLAHDAAKPFVDAFNKIAGAVKKVVGYLGDVIDLVKDVIGLLGKIKVPHISLPSLPFGSPRPGELASGVGGTLGKASQVARLFGLQITNGYRTPEHNAAVGGVPNSLHTHGTPANPGAVDLVGPASAMYQALAWAQKNLPLKEGLVHDVGSGLHLHLGFFKRGGRVPGAGPGDKVPAMLEPGEFVIRKKIVDKFGPTFFANVNGMRDGGIVEAARAAKAAGWRGQNLVRAVAIAGAESNYNRRAHALNGMEDSRGPWQVNVRAHPWARRMNLYQWGAGAAAAHRVWEQAGGSFSPWTTWPGKAGAYMAKARRAVAGLSGGKNKGKKRPGFGVKFGPEIHDPPPVPAGSLSGDNLLPSGPSSDPGSSSDGAAAELAAQIKRMNDFNDWLVTNQGPALVGAVVSAVNGGIGGRVGLGFQGIRSAPGSVAGL